MELIGRDAELALLADRLRDRRLVTLVGPGGIGKTALARAAVDRCGPDFGEGARLVDLTRVESAAGVRESLAAQLGYASFGALLDSPGDHPVLVVVDNCERVIDAAADAVERLLDACRMPTVLATSRAALDLPGETVLPVGPLELPPSGVTDAPAVRLFVERARDAGGGPVAGEAVAELCRRLDGVPLAIELAAARVRAMTAAEILDRLGAGLDVLDRPRRRGSRRHQSLQAAIRWSYDLLDDSERLLFDRLSAFTGPFTAADAHAVAGDPDAPPSVTQDVLERLVAASMVVADTAGEVTWYRELDTLQTFARERLDERGEPDAVHARLVDHVVDRVAGIVVRGAATWDPDALGELLALYDTIGTVLRWCVDHDAAPDRALLLTAALWGVVHQAHTEETGALAEAVVARWADAEHPLRADAVATAATCRYMLGDTAGAVALARKGLAAAEASPYAPATLRRAIAQALRAEGDTDGALGWFAEASTAARERGLTALAVEADTDRAQIHADVGGLDAALALVHEARAEAEEAEAPVATAWARAVEGSILLRVDLDLAEATLGEARDACRALRYAGGLSVAQRSLALTALCRGDLPAAAARLLELLDDLLGRGSTYELRAVFDAASAVLDRAGRRQPAADLAATALALPVVSITASVGHELFPLDAGGGRPLATRDAIVSARAELGVLAAGRTTPPRGSQPGTAAVGGAGGAAGDLADADDGGPVGVFRRVGDHWEVGYGGERATVRHGKGMTDLARLLAAPGRELHSLDLIGGLGESDTGEVIDPGARRAYEQRIRELQADLDEADAAHDRARAERATAEMDALVDQLTAALGLGGQARRRGGAAERARSAVTQRIRSTMRRIEAVHPRLGRHLRASVRTGVYCAYAPEEPVRWTL
jgi:predicted ATPase/tetratricopeptide (TPR) repeat protein